MPLHPTNWVITWRDIQLGKDRVFKENFCLIYKTHHKARGGDVDGDGGVHYLFDFPYLTEILPIDPALCDGQHL